jgi:HAD superfamily hydrolase (TIGR01509 family)
MSYVVRPGSVLMGVSVPSPLARRAVLLLDLDGVLRRFDPLAASPIEARYHVSFDRLAAAAFDPQFAHPAVRGEISRDEWIRRAGEHLGSVPAMQAFLGLRGAVVPEVLALVRQVRATGLHVGLLTNATDTLPSELEHLGLLGEFDLVFSSAMFGYIKPEPELFRRVTDRACGDFASILFADDQMPNVASAIATGWSAHHYTTPVALRDWLGKSGALGAPLPPGPPPLG